MTVKQHRRQSLPNYIKCMQSKDGPLFKALRVLPKHEFENYYSNILPQRITNLQNHNNSAI
jgi:hypothetical protein